MTAATDDISGNEFRPVLYQNVPNPFRNATAIHYSLPDNRNVQLFIRNSDGMMVDTLVNEVKATGEYTIEWKPGNLPAGIYYLVFHAERFVEVRKLILLDH